MSLQCEFQRIAEEIQNNLSDSVRIRFDDSWCLRIVIACDSEFLHACLDGYERYAFFEQRIQIEFDETKFEAAILELHEIKNIVDHIQQELIGIQCGLDVLVHHTLCLLVE